MHPAAPLTVAALGLFAVALSASYWWAAAASVIVLSRGVWLATEEQA